MRKSARIIGQDYGLTSQEMNWVLHDRGFLEGRPGAWSPTDKAKSFVTETDYWHGARSVPVSSLITWDDSIEAELAIDDAMKAWARKTASEHRAGIRAASAAAATPAAAKPAEKTLRELIKQFAGRPLVKKSVVGIAIVALSVAAFFAVRYVYRRIEERRDV